MITVGDYLLKSYQNIKVPSDNVSKFIKWVKDKNMNEPGSRDEQNFKSGFK